MRLKLNDAGLSDEAADQLAAWKEAKADCIGGSKAATAAGVGKYGSRMRLWMEMTGRDEPEDISNVERVRWGTLLEATVSREIEHRTGYRLNPGRGTLSAAEFVGSFGFLADGGGQSLYRSKKHPRLVYSPDGFANDLDGSLGLVETKTTGLFAAKAWDDEDPPEDVILQVQHGMGVLGLPWTILPVLVAGQDFRVYRVERDQGLIDMLFERELGFLELVREDVSPPLEEPVHPDTLAALKRLHPADNGESVFLPHAAQELDELRTQLTATKKAAEAELKEIEAKFRNWIGGNTFAQIPGSPVQYSLKTTNRKGYTRTVQPTTYRTLRRKEIS